MSESTYVVTRTHILTTSCVVVSVWEPGQLGLPEPGEGHHSTTTTFSEHPEICEIHPRWWGKVDSWFVEADFPVEKYPACSDARMQAVGAYHDCLYQHVRAVAWKTLADCSGWLDRHFWMGEIEFVFDSVEQARQFADEARHTIIQAYDVHENVKESMNAIKDQWQAMEASNG